MKATIQGFDDPDGTLYLLCRDGEPVALHEWPQPLYQLEPDAVMLPSYTGDVPGGGGKAVVVAVNPEPERDPAMVNESDWLPQCEYSGPLELWESTMLGHPAVILPGWTAYDTMPRGPLRDRERIPGRGR